MIWNITDEKPEEIQFFRWGIIPHWVKDKETAHSIRNNTLNAKSETIFEKASFKYSIRNKRCLILCSGFFEWQKVKGKKYPYYISLQNDEVFVFGGIWSSWTDTESGEIINTYAVITVEANELVGKIHNTKKRMPLILEPEKALQWIDKNSTFSRLLQYGFKDVLSECTKFKFYGLCHNRISGSMYGNVHTTYEILYKYQMI